MATVSGSASAATGSGASSTGLASISASAGAAMASGFSSSFHETGSSYSVVGIGGTGTITEVSKAADGLLTPKWCAAIDESTPSMSLNAAEPAIWSGTSTIGFYAIRVCRLVRLHLADCHQHGNLHRVQRPAYLFADFQPGISRHVNVKNDDVGLLLGNLLDCSCAVADCHNVIASFGKDLLAHILGSHAVIGK